MFWRGGFSGSIAFNDALLPDVASEEEIDFVSAWLCLMGYLGGGLLVPCQRADGFETPDVSALRIQGSVNYSFLSVGPVVGGFTVFAVAWVKEKKTSFFHAGRGGAVSQGFRQFVGLQEGKTPQDRFLFLLAYWFYIDGVDTIIGWRWTTACPSGSKRTI